MSDVLGKLTDDDLIRLRTIHADLNEASTGYEVKRIKMDGEALFRAIAKRCGVDVLKMQIDPVSGLVTTIPEEEGTDGE